MYEYILSKGLKLTAYTWLVFVSKLNISLHKNHKNTAEGRIKYLNVWGTKIQTTIFLKTFAVLLLAVKSLSSPSISCRWQSPGRATGPGSCWTQRSSSRLLVCGCPARRSRRRDSQYVGFNTFTFTFRAFSRRFYPERLIITTFVGIFIEASVYEPHSLYTTRIAMIRCYTMLSTIFKCQEVQHTISA